MSSGEVIGNDMATKMVDPAVACEDHECLVQVGMLGGGVQEGSECRVIAFGDGPIQIILAYPKPFGRFGLGLGSGGPESR